ncbi:natterin-3-like [Ambystoma mexicanum]|uniref:natterin-3-like n=1 Tax=Ambystoma mexicanum TaxID=8296 RepID=UPI0037E81F3C
MEAWARNLLNEMLEDLIEKEFKHFKINLDNVPQKIPRGKIEKLDHLELADLMVQFYQPCEALHVAVNVLEKINRRDLSEILQKKSQNVPAAKSLPRKGTRSETECPDKSEMWSNLALLAAQLHDALTPSPEGHRLNQLPMMTGSTDVDGKIIFNDCKNLKWVDWAGEIPNGAVSIENTVYSRTDYVSVANTIGYYTPSKGPYCYYSLSDKEFSSPTFKILVNEDHFERLEWKSGSWGSVPNDAIRCNPGENTFVGKNEYGLGKVVPKFSAFFLPCDGKEYYYKRYEVLTVCRDYHTESITNIQYQMNDGTAEYMPHSILDESIMENKSANEVKRFVTFQKEILYQHCWETDRPAKAGVSLHFSAKLPFTATGEKGDVVFNEKSQEGRRMTFSKSEMKKIDEKVEVPVPPNHVCELVLEARKITACIPYRATLTRTYSDGHIRTTSIKGVFTATGFDSVGIHVKGYHLLSDK